jgi:hypothetical protein
MCTMISTKHPFSGQAKGRAGWFPIDQLYLGYDHPQRDDSEHAVLIDFVNEDQGPNARLAVELSVEAATDLARRLLETVTAANRYEAR